MITKCRPCLLCKFRNRCNLYDFRLNLRYTLEPCWIGTGPYDITVQYMYVYILISRQENVLLLLLFFLFSYRYTDSV